MKMIDLLKDLNSRCHFMSRERSGKVSNSEMIRWLNNGSVRVNGKKLKAFDPIPDKIESFILFPKGRTITLL